MKSKEAHVENETVLKQETARTFEKISNAVLAALNEIHPTHASTGFITMDASGDGMTLAVDDDDVDITAIQKAQNKIVQALRVFRGINPALSDQNITIGFCIKQFRSMAPTSEGPTRGRAAHATFQGQKHDRE
jgi:hypothetical protein